VTGVRYIVLGRDGQVHEFETPDRLHPAEDVLAQLATLPDIPEEEAERIAEQLKEALRLEEEATRLRGVALRLEAARSSRPESSTRRTSERRISARSSQALHPSALSTRRQGGSRE